MKHWIVVTPEYGTVVPITDEGEGPTEYEADVVEIEAETRRDAITLGVKMMLTLGSPYQWCRDARADGCSPFAGVKAFTLPPAAQEDSQ